MDQKVSVQNLAAEIKKSIKQYTTEISEEISETVKEVTKDIMEESVKELSPVRKAGEVYITRNGKKIKAKANLQPGAYKKGWRSVTKNKPTVGRTYGTVYNKTNWQLTWLLELGHKARNYEKSQKIIAPSPKGGHIQPSLDKAMTALDKKITNILK